MTQRKSAYIKGVDELIAETPFERVTARYGLPAPDEHGGEYRINCVFNEACQESQYGQLTVNLQDSARLIYCHSCKTRGNLLTLLHGLEHHRPPAGGRLRGDEFKAAVKLLREINDEPVADAAPAPAVLASDSRQEVPGLVNAPLRKHEKEAARSLENLYEDLIVDPAEMTPKAAAYFRERPWLTEEVCRKWGVGYLPRNGRSLFRGWVVYTQRNARGDVISYSGRDAGYADKLQKWIRDGRPDGKQPTKHRYVSGYHRGLELYGQQVSRLQESHIESSLRDVGLVVVEGANDVVRLDCLGVAAVGLCSNRATDEQTQKIVRFAEQASGGRVVLLPDCDAEGEAGCGGLLWKLNEAGLDVRLGWSRAMHGGAFSGRQPEQLTDDEWTGTLLPFLRRTPS